MSLLMTKAAKKKRKNPNSRQRKRIARTKLDASFYPACLKPPPNSVKSPK